MAATKRSAAVDIEFAASVVPCGLSWPWSARSLAADRASVVEDRDTPNRKVVSAVAVIAAPEAETLLVRSGLPHSPAGVVVDDHAVPV